MSFKPNDRVKIGNMKSGFRIFEGPFTGRIGIVTRQIQEEPGAAYLVDVDNEKDLMFFGNELIKLEDK